MSEFRRSEAGHVNILAVTALAAICVILLAVGAGGNSALKWIGGIGAAVFLLVQFYFIHLEIGGILGRLDQLEEDKG